MGVMKWYLHPSIEDTAIHSLIFYMQKISPGSRSGRLRVQGGQVIHFMEGSGYTVIDGEKFSWEEGDVLQIPLRWDGVVFQHFNNDPKREAILVCAEPNFVHSLGVDRGSGFEVLETAPEYKR
jgi:gentisate 1,2-dioxygenase